MSRMPSRRSSSKANGKGHSKKKPLRIYRTFEQRRRDFALTVSTEMYKVGQSASGPRAGLPNIQRSVYNSNYGRRTGPHYDHRSPRGRGGQGQHSQEHPGDFPISPNQLPVFNKKAHKHNHNHNYQTYSTPNEEAVNFLQETWRAFSQSGDGKPDESIVRYKPKTDLPKDFVSFDMDKFLAERLLKAVDLDLKIVTG
uniref:Uncharacterized protein n=1 Tax=Plectus sambesii TaxID=2011161 RepID=A0A914X9U2_9BILA